MSKATGPHGNVRKAVPLPAKQRRAPAAKKPLPLVLSRPKPAPLPAKWRQEFLRALAATSNVSASAQEAHISPSKAYQERRKNHEFAAEWHAALQEGYEHLEMEVLAFLRGTDPERKMDVANAIRLLAAHRDTVARMRAANEDNDEQAVLDSIDQMIDLMRRRSAADTKPVSGKPKPCEGSA